MSQHAALWKICFSISVKLLLMTQLFYVSECAAGCAVNHGEDDSFVKIYSHYILLVVHLATRTMTKVPSQNLHSIFTPLYKELTCEVERSVLLPSPRIPTLSMYSWSVRK